MEELYLKMREYIKMTEELPFDEFADYFRKTMDFLQMSYQDLTTEELLQAKGICDIISANAKARAMKKDANYKKFKKMDEKADFWQAAIEARLTKDGMTKKEISEKEDALWE